VLVDRAAILDRHAIRRTAGVPTVSLLVGPIGGGVETWRRWAAGEGRRVVVVHRNPCPYVEWVRSVAEDVDLPAAAVGCVARRLERDPDELLAAWRTKTPAELERFWNTLAPDVDDHLLRAVATLAIDQGPPGVVAAALNGLGEQTVPMIVRLAPSSKRPSILFVTGSSDDLSTAGHVAATWVMRVPQVPVAVVVPAGVWNEYLVTAPESRTKALLKEGEVAVPAIDAATVEQILTEAGAMGNAAAAIAPHGADEALLDAAVAAVQATDQPLTNEAQDDRARSAAERFLFRFLESLPETAGRFELNAPLDFSFGPRRAEVDLLCRSPRIAIELDGYFRHSGSAPAHAGTEQQATVDRKRAAGRGRPARHRPPCPAGSGAAVGGQHPIPGRRRQGGLLGVATACCGVAMVREVTTAAPPGGVSVRRG
jgi:hypothetical protein